MLKDLSGQSLCGLEVVGRAANHGKKAAWLCRCLACGCRLEVIGQHLRSGRAKCPCQRRRSDLEVDVVDDATPSQLRSRGRAAWLRILNQCHRRSSTDYPYYGGRGVYVCERWRTLSVFLADVGEAPSDEYIFGLLGDHYGPGECKWMTRSDRARLRPTTRLVDVGEGVQRPLIELAEGSEVGYATLRSRVANGQDVQSALSDPAIKSWELRSQETEYGGVTYPSLAELARAYGLTPKVLYDRLHWGWPIAEAVETPVGGTRRPAV